MDLRGRCNERMHRVNGPAARLAAGDKPAPLIGDGPIDSDDTAVE